MMEHGYRSTSYAMIAEQASVPRAQVQYYFPKKAQIVTGLLNRALDLSIRYIDTYGLQGSDGYATLFRAGQIYFTFLFQDEQLRRLTLDVMADREISSELLFLNQRWADDFLSPNLRVEGEFEEAFAMVVGGTYELCYLHLSRGEKVDVVGTVRRMLIAFMTLTGTGAADARRVLEGAELDAKKTLDLAHKMRRELPEMPQS